MIVGIVIGVAAFAAIVAVAIYCFVSSGSKYGTVDPAVESAGFEEEAELKSMSVL